LFARNFYKIKQSLNFCKDEIEQWYEMVKEKNQARVAIVHNNLSLEHFIYNQRNSALISWDNYKYDTPIMDVVHLYHTEYLNHDFSAFFQKYFDYFELLEEEKKLLFVLISLPLYFELTENEFTNTKLIKEKMNYIFYTEKLIGPYYPKE